MHSELLQIIYYDFGYTIYKSEFSVVFQVFMGYFYSVDEIWEINGIFAATGGVVAMKKKNGKSTKTVTED